MEYVAQEGWGKLPDGWDWVEVAGVAVDARDRVHVFNRGPHPVVVLGSDGELLDSWGEGQFRRPHGVTIGPDDAVYLTDDVDHTVRKFSSTHELLLTLGTSGRPSDTGATSLDYRTIRRAGPPFHFPTNVALAPSGDIYVSDGYGNARVHRFSAAGELIASWGTPGAGPGQFHLPHGIAVDAGGVVHVADRENSRIQRFTSSGEFIDAWSDVARPCQVAVGPGERVYVAELGYRAGMWPGTRAPRPDATGGRVSVFARDGALLARWGGGTDPCAPGDFFAPHGLCVDSQGAVYVAEVVRSAAGARATATRGCHALQKFVPR